MIENNRDAGEFDIDCDGCDESISIDTEDDWSEMIQELKDEGWKIVKDADGWSHYCPGCAAESDRSIR